MIGFLRGKILSKNQDNLSCTVFAHHVGYEVTLPRLAFDSLALEERVDLWIHTHVREDILHLYGFPLEIERNLFRLLLSVSGLGPKTAISLLSEHGPKRLVELVIRQDSTGLAEASGVGKKLAQKIGIELSTKLEKLQWLESVTMTADRTAPKTESKEELLRADLVSALVNLGYHPNHIKTTMDSILSKTDSSKQGFEHILKSALSELSGRARPTEAF